jgi:NitT/TauT family transport system substrate-binding protein
MFRPVFRAASVLVFFALAAVSVPANAADKIKIAISQKGFWDTMPAYIAIERGYYKEFDLDAQNSWTSGGAETVQAVSTRSVDFATGTGFLGVISAFAKGAEIRVISQEIRGTPETFWYVRADSPIKSIADFGGKKWSYTRPGSTTHMIVLRASRGINPPPELISAGGLPAARTQTMTGQIDIGLSVPPFNLDLVRKGEARIVFYGKDVAELQNQTIRVNIVRADLLKENRPVVERFMKAYVKALDWMYDNPEEAAQFYAKFNEISIEDARETVKYYPRANVAVAPISGMEQNVAQAIENKFIEQPLTPEQVKTLIDIVHDPAKK